MLTTPQLALLMLFGALGTLSRYFLTKYLNTLFTLPYLWGTTLVNLLGCFLFALVYALALRFHIPEAYKVICLTGFLGAFTTFSALMAEAHALLAQSAFLCLVYMLIHAIMGLGIFQLVLYMAKA